MVMQCACGAKLRIKPESVGKKAKCPKCGTILTIALPTQPIAKEPEPAEFALSDLASNEIAAAVDTRACPGCSAPLATTVRICTACGYDLLKGRSLAAAPSVNTGSAAVAVAKNLAKATGRFALGTSLAAIAAILGGIAWFCIAWYANLEVGYVAWGIGVTTGIAMLKGSGEPSTKAGIVASIMAISSIVLSKAAIFWFVLMAVVTGNTDDMTLKRQFVAGSMTEQLLDDRGVKDESQREQQWEAVYAEAEKTIKDMSDEEVTKLADKYREEAEKMEAQSEPTTDAKTDTPAPGGESDGGIKDLLTFFIQTQFNLFDALWAFLAIGSAFKIAGRGATEADD
jgi:hypothetical protein